MSSENTSTDYWEARYQQKDTPWERGCAAPPLREYLGTSKVSGPILVVGCGYGHDVRLLAQNGAEPVGLDIAPSALAKARSFPRVGREDFRLGDLFNLEEDLVGTFSGVFEHTCFCAITPEQRQAYVQAVNAVLKKDGFLLGIFYIDVEDPEGPPFQVSSAELDRLFHPFFKTLKKWVPTVAYPGREGREEMRFMRKI